MRFFRFLAVAACIITIKTPGLSAESQFNIVLIISDDHGRNDLGCYGNAAIKTPNLDALASEGVRFTRAHCTTASCSASRSVILTGLYNHANGQYGHQHSYHHFKTFNQIPSLPVLLKKQGYVSARIGKFHVAPESVYAFDYALAGDSRHAVAMADSCGQFFKERGPQPFFLLYCTSDPHRGGGVQEDDPLRPDRFGNRDSGYSHYDELRFTPAEVRVPKYLPDLPATRAELAQYYQSVARMDAGVGRLMQHLKSAGIWDQTIVVYISDNGIAFPGAKTNLYDPGMRLPCIVRHPNVPNPGGTTDIMINWADLTPTLLEFAGADLSRLSHSSAGKPDQSVRFHGRSFKDALLQNRTAGWDTVYASHTFHEITMYYPMRVVQNRRYKLIWNIASGLPYPFASDLYAAATWKAAIRSREGRYGARSIADYINRPQFELYDMVNDNEETRNLASHPAHQKRLKALQAQLRRFQDATDDPWIVKWTYE